MAEKQFVSDMRNPQMMLVVSFFIVMVVNAVVLAIANTLFPMNIELGTVSLSPFVANLLFSAALSLITTLAMPFVKELEFSMGKKLSPMGMMLFYFVVNVVGIWLLTRASHVFGVGVTSWLVVLALALVLDFAQGMAMMQVERARKAD